MCSQMPGGGLCTSAVGTLGYCGVTGIATEAPALEIASESDYDALRAGKHRGDVATLRLNG